LRIHEQHARPIAIKADKMGSTTKDADVWHGYLEELLLWRDPVKSALVLFLFTGLYVLLEWTSWSLISIGATVALFAVITSWLWSTLASFLNRPGPPVPRILREGVSEKQVQELAQQVTPVINQGLAVGYRLATGKDIFLTAQVAFVLYVTSKLGSWFSVVGWLYATVLLAFTIPKVYELKKPEIDAAAKNVQQQTKQLYEQHAAPLVAKIPRASSATPAKAAKADLQATAESFRNTVNDAAAGTSGKKAL